VSEREVAQLSSSEHISICRAGTQQDTENVLGIRHGAPVTTD
jgi:hypothetical protein